MSQIEPIVTEALPAESYGRMLRLLLPPGEAWETQPDSVRQKLLNAFGEEFSRIEQRAFDMVAEFNPATALETLGEWEEMLGLPDSCLTEIPDSVAERRAAIVSKWTARGGQSPQYFIDLAASLGYTVTITEFFLSTASCGPAECGDAECMDESCAYTWLVTVVGAVQNGVAEAFCGMAECGDAIGGYDQLDIECVIGRYAPAHTIVVFAYDI